MEQGYIAGGWRGEEQIWGPLFQEITFQSSGVQCLRALVFLLSLHSSLQLVVPPKERSPLQRGGKGLFSSSCTFPRRTDGLQVPPLSPAVIPGATS